MYELTEILRRSIEVRASDIHLTVGMPPCYRVDGVLAPYGEEKLTPQSLEELLVPILEVRNRGELQENGQTDFAHAIAGVGRFRVNVFKQRGTLASVMRSLPFEIPQPDVLGIPRSVVEMTQKKRGLVLVTGPTGSGKSTTLASLLDVINREHSEHIITLEDPIEYLHRHKKSVVNQREIGSDSGTYAQALRAALRQDPDVILVGEMRDLETISTAITAAETGHLVFSTLHTIGADKTIDRIIDVFPPSQQQQIRVQLSVVLECIVSQQLLRRADGKGRVAALEVLFANAAVRNLIREGKTFQIPSVMQTNKRQGMQTMDDALLDLFMKRIITGEEALTYAQDPVAMGRNTGLDF
ncbi:MAG: type IV pilus twitching motility protein PilT [Eubacteriales bacterium]|nr:type IV pilus twitching motility protein PilT [Eubacteriales bacterium]